MKPTHIGPQWIGWEWTGSISIETAMAYTGKLNSVPIGGVPAGMLLCTGLETGRTPGTIHADGKPWARIRFCYLCDWKCDILLPERIVVLEPYERTDFAKISHILERFEFPEEWKR